MKRGYLVTGENTGLGFPVVAHNAREAKLIVWKEWHYELGAWIDMRVQWRRDACVEDLSYGLVTNDLDALHRKLVDYLCG